MANQMEYTYFPVRLDEMNSQIKFDEVREGRVTVDGVKVTAHYLNHTSICLGYRFEADGKTVVYASDTEPHGITLAPTTGEHDPRADREPHFVHDKDRRLAEFVEGADLLILDAQYTDDEYSSKVGWVIRPPAMRRILACWESCAAGAVPPRSVRGDDELDLIVETAGRRAATYGSDARIFAAAEGMTVRL